MMKLGGHRVKNKTLKTLIDIGFVKAGQTLTFNSGKKNNNVIYRAKILENGNLEFNGKEMNSLGSTISEMLKNKNHKLNAWTKFQYKGRPLSMIWKEYEKTKDKSKTKKIKQLNKTKRKSVKIKTSGVNYDVKIFDRLDIGTDVLMTKEKPSSGIVKKFASVIQNLSYDLGSLDKKKHKKYVYVHKEKTYYSLFALVKAMKTLTNTKKNAWIHLRYNKNGHPFDGSKLGEIKNIFVKNQEMFNTIINKYHAKNKENAKRLMQEGRFITPSNSKSFEKDSLELSERQNTKDDKTATQNLDKTVSQNLDNIEETQEQQE